MQSTSNEFKAAIAGSGRRFSAYVEINGTKYSRLDGLTIKGGIIQGDDVGIGGTYLTSVSFILKSETSVSEANIIGQTATVYIGLWLDAGGSKIEYLKMGVFRINTAKLTDRNINIEGYDNMVLTNAGFFSNLKGTQKISTIMNEQCKKLGINFIGGADDVSVDVDKLQGYKISEVISILASYCGKNAMCNRDGDIVFKWFDVIDYTVHPSRYSDPLTLGDKDESISRLICTIDKTNAAISSGADKGKSLSFSNQFMTQSRLDALYQRIKSFSYRSCTLNYVMGDPSLDAGDVIKVKDKTGRIYSVPIFLITYKFTGGFQCVIESKAKNEEQENATYKGPVQQLVERNYTEYISTKELLADTIIAYNSKFQTVETDYLQVNKEISAVSGKFGTLQSDLANFKVTNTEELNAIIAKINTLETIDLTAVKADISQANIGIANINTLLAGSVTAGSTQTIVLNAKNTTISNALIKSAMIDTLDFNKITGVDINTTNFKVHSKDGMSQWSDNTIQIKDANRVRVQIGKDASNDYNMYVWDATGKLMFDATGVTANGIQKPIIKDSMVANDANIAGDKLNITSVINKINGNTTLIEASHIKYDGKSLDVAFNSLQTTVDGIEVGGRNLALNTSTERVNLRNCPYYISTIGIDKTKYYTVSFYFKASKAGNYLVYLNDDSGAGRTHIDFGKISAADTDYHYYTFTGKPTGTTAEVNMIIMRIYGNAADLLGSVKQLKLEEGNKNTTYSPAPEDYDGQIATLTGSIKSQSTLISAAQGQISTLISDNTQTKKDVTTIQSGLTTATGNISTLQSNYSSLNQTVSGLNATVGSHTSSITSLTSTANTALTNANNANTKIDGLQIGGRNLLRFTGDLRKGSALSPETATGISMWSGAGGTLVNTADGLKLTRGGTSTDSIWVPIIAFGCINSGETVTLSFKYRSNATTTGNFYFIQSSDPNVSIAMPALIVSETEWKEYKWTFSHAQANIRTLKSVLMFYSASTTGQWIEIKKGTLKLEKGNKATDWSPALEDIDASIKTVTDKQAAFDVSLTGIAGRVSSTESSITTVNNTVNNNKANWDKAPTALANANSAQTTANTANSLANTNKTNLANLTTTVTETKSTVATMKLDYEGFKTNVSSTYTTKTELANLQIGGRNLIRLSYIVNRGCSTFNYNKANNTWTCVAPKGSDVWGRGFYLLSGGKIPVERGKTFIVSFEVNPNIDCTWTCDINNGYAGAPTGNDFDDTAKRNHSNFSLKANVWTKIWFSYTAKSDVAYDLYDANTCWGIVTTSLTADVSFQFRNVMGEYATKAGDWSPAPEDIDASIATVDGKFANYSTTTQMNTAITQTKSEITQTVTNNYTELKGGNTLNHALSMIATGKLVQQDPVFAAGFNYVAAYNLNGSLTRVTKPADCPTSSTHCMQIQANGASTVAGTGIGGFYQTIASRANAIFVIKYLIKLPVGYKLMTATNSMGAGYTDKFLTPTDGTGKWTEYVRMVECGSTGTFSNGGHIWVSGATIPTASAPLIWQIGAVYQYDVTNSSDLYTRLTTAESKLTATSLITTFTTAINGGTAFTTTKFTMDSAGLHIKGGGFDISNNTGTKVLYADTNGNLTLNGSIVATSGTIAGWEINKNTIGNKLVSGVADGRRTGIAPGIDTKTGNLQPKDGLAFWAGAYWKSGSTDESNVAISEAPFRVYADGRLYATNANISGIINARSGSIASFDITENWLCSEQLVNGRVERSTYIMADQIELRLTGSSSSTMSSKGFLVRNDLTDTVYTYITSGNITATGKIFAFTMETGGLNVSNTATIQKSGSGADSHLLEMKQDSNMIGLFTTAYSYQGLRFHWYIDGAWSCYMEYRGNGINLYGELFVSSTFVARSTAQFDLRLTNSNGIEIMNPNTTTLSIGYGFRSANMNTMIYGKEVDLVNAKGTSLMWWSDSSPSWAGYFAPNSVDTALGTTNYRWWRLYAANAVDVSSDIRLKKNITTYDTRYEEMYMDLKPVTYEWKSHYDGKHCGLIAQWVKESMVKHGIRDSEFAVLTHDEKTDQYGIAYAELTSLNMHMIQKTIHRVDDHETRITELERENKGLKGQLACLQAQLNAHTNPTA